MNDNALLKAKIDLYNIISSHAMDDYKQANYKNDKKISKKHIPYSLSYDTKKASEIYKSIFNLHTNEITLEQETEIKYFLLIYRTSRTEYLTEGYKGGKWYYNEQVENLGMEA